MHPNSILMHAVNCLYTARKAGMPGERLPENCRPQDLDMALEIQRCVGLMLKDAVGGWKSSVLGPPIATAPIYAPSIHRHAPCPVLPHGGLAAVEPEIAFILGCDLPPRSKPYAAKEIEEAIGETRLALELIGSRYARPSEVSFPELLADNLSNQGVFVGPLVEWLPVCIPDSLTITIAGLEEAISVYPGRNPGGRPLGTFVRLMQELTRRGEAVSRGQVVLTGSFAGVLELPFGSDLRITFGTLGVLRVEFSPTESASSQVTE